MKVQVERFCEARDWDRYHNAKDLAIGVSTEAGELLDLFRFMSLEEVEGMFQADNELEKIEDEMADVMFFLLRMGQRYQVNITRALGKKMKKNEKKYLLSDIFFIIGYKIISQFIFIFRDCFTYL